jgi:hypothetical protein
MNQKLIFSLAALVAGFGLKAPAQPADVWENWGQISAPLDPIDARTFINHAGASFTFGGSGLYNTFDTINYTNQGLMVGDPGFVFQTIPSNSGQATRAQYFVNQAGGANNGVINCSGVFTFILNPQLPAGNLTGNSKCAVLADNIINSGSINMDASSLISLRGKYIDLSHGALTMSNPSTFLGLFNAGELDGYWGVGTAIFNYFTIVPPAPGQASLLDPGNLIFNFGGGTAALSDEYNVVTRNYFLQFQDQFLVNPLLFANQVSTFGGSNVLTEIVALLNTNLTVTPKVFFPASFSGNAFGIVVQWQWNATNFPTGSFSTNNYLYLTDTFGEVTNLQTVINGFAGIRPTQRPVTYTFVQGTPFSTGAGATPLAPGTVQQLLTPGPVTNDYAAYQAILTAGTQLASDVAGGDVTNMVGRIEVAADNFLNLNATRISSLNYLSLKATNHFAGSKNAIISSPNLDLLLRATNATIEITNLIAPYLNHPEGTIDLWSARWTNVVVDVTNCFHVLFVNSQFSPVTRPVVETLKLWVTNSTGANNNLLISDVLNVSSNLVLNAERITITTNYLNMFTPIGELNILNPNIVWSTVTPGLMYLTNWGGISAQNAMFFGGSRSQPPYNTNLVDVPYQAFVNHGGVTNQGTLIWSQYFENGGGVFQAGQGSIQLRNAVTSLMTNGAFYAAGGEIGIYSGSLYASNHVFLAGDALTLSMTNLLDDGSLTHDLFTMTNKNFWQVGNGINLLSLPPQASLLGTTISSFANDFQLVVNTWAGADRGNSPAGFTNNAAIGHLILECPTNCTFEFRPAAGNSALYVDEIEFQDFVATNVDEAKNYASIQIDPGMKIYYGQAIANGISIAERLDGKNGGGFVWVSNYNAGFFSSTNVVYPDGTTNRLNAALVASCDIDSNGNGIPNCIDPAPIPILSPAGLGLTVTATNLPAAAAMVSWTAFPGTSNTLLSASSPNSANWTVVTNVYYPGPFPGKMTVPDLIRSNGPKFYRLRVSGQ